MILEHELSIVYHEFAKKELMEIRGGFVVIRVKEQPAPSDSK